MFAGKQVELGITILSETSQLHENVCVRPYMEAGGWVAGRRETLKETREGCTKGKGAGADEVDRGGCDQSAFSTQMEK